MILDKIIENKRSEVGRAKISKPLGLLKREFQDLEKTRDFYQSIRPNGTTKVIAEIKCASPSKGVLRPDYNPVEISKSYARGGASAISVLTDSRFFKGSLDHLRDVRSSVEIPLLRKDFIIDSYQVYESRFYGADAILLIVAVLESTILKELLELAHSLDMNAIVEIHNEAELDKAIKAGSKIIGINNRDLKTFDVSLETSLRLCKLIPKGKIVISESGISSSDDLKRLKSAGINVLLIGERFMRAPEPGEELRKLLLECNSSI
jgi:indole-3-glycerol phosphate synthase